ncbi:MAG: hypothetical protein Q9187_006030 [Circinaria calcarea]
MQALKSQLRAFQGLAKEPETASVWRKYFSHLGARAVPANTLGKGKEAVLKLKTTIVSYPRHHPIIFSLQVLGTSAAVVPSVIIGGPLALLGFGSLGPVGGSIAAGLQASIGSVPAGSAFAFFQSAAMGGAALSGVAAGGAGVAGVATAPIAVGGLRGWFGRRLSKS